MVYTVYYMYIIAIGLSKTQNQFLSSIANNTTSKNSMLMKFTHLLTVIAAKVVQKIDLEYYVQFEFRYTSWLDSSNMRNQFSSSITNNIITKNSVLMKFMHLLTVTATKVRAKN